MTEELWEQLALEYYDRQIERYDKHHLKKNQYPQCCYRIYPLRLAQSDESEDLFDETVRIGCET